MKDSRRFALKALASLAALSCLPRTWAAEPEVDVIRINIPGPHSLLFAPIELIPALGIDRALGVSLSIRYLPSGVRSLEGGFKFEVQLAYDMSVPLSKRPREGF